MGEVEFDGPTATRLEIRATAAVCCTVLAILAVEKGNAARGAQLLGHADRLRGDVGAPAPAFQLDNIGRARDAARALLGHDAFVTAFEQGQRVDLDELVDFGARTGQGGQSTGALHQRRHEGGSGLQPNPRRSDGGDE